MIGKDFISLTRGVYTGLVIRYRKGVNVRARSSAQTKARDLYGDKKGSDQPGRDTANGTSILLSRRLLLAAGPVALAGCVSPDSPSDPETKIPQVPRPFLRMYSAMPDERFYVPAADIAQIDPRFYRRRVPYVSEYGVGTMVVDPAEKFLYLVMEDGYAMRYGIGVGRQGFGWSGTATIRRKVAWPTWTPPAEMIQREPRYAEYADGMKPGLDNPLGARALYLYQNGRDTLYRLHGTSEERSIGRAVSSGCVRLLNQDIIDLYNRTPIGTRVIVLDRKGVRGTSPNPAGAAGIW